MISMRPVFPNFTRQNLFGQIIDKSDSLIMNQKNITRGVAPGYIKNFQFQISVFRFH
ncbi:Uncharacterized protein dnm_018760 [Desulfonema magnum]|uniref:Uncharacterized protein n=1 Tax=Desulfonema magnum TaxID=45655 RepID=A0A975BI36_9BACT|nr:Uncharacterized protein dnm_018760 [Desulfonema magnum]